jgi:hypothetical protein
LLGTLISVIIGVLVFYFSYTKKTKKYLCPAAMNICAILMALLGNLAMIWWLYIPEIIVLVSFF